MFHNEKIILLFWTPLEDWDHIFSTLSFKLNLIYEIFLIYCWHGIIEGIIFVSKQCSSYSKLSHSRLRSFPPPLIGPNRVLEAMTYYILSGGLMSIFGMGLLFPLEIEGFHGVSKVLNYFGILSHFTHCTILYSILYVLGYLVIWCVF